MLPDWVSNQRPLTYESGALPIALRGPADFMVSFSESVWSDQYVSVLWQCTDRQNTAFLNYTDDQSESLKKLSGKYVQIL